MSELRDARQGVLGSGCGVGGQAKCPLLLLPSNRCLFQGPPPYLLGTLVLSPSPAPKSCTLYGLVPGCWGQGQMAVTSLDEVGAGG